MTNPGGNKRRFRRSFDPPKRRQETPEGGARNESPSSPAASVSSHCQRCQLPLFGDHLAVGIETKQSQLRHDFCEACGESLGRWLTGPREEVQGPRKERKYRSHKIPRGDGESVRRPNVPAHKLARHESAERRKHLFLVVGSIMGVTSIAIVVTLLTFLINSGNPKKR